MSKSNYRFIGQTAEIHAPGLDVGLEQFGQAIALDDQIAGDLVAQHCQIISESSFLKIGFTEKELAMYGSVVSHETASAEFQKKKRAALDAWQEFYSSVLNPKPAVQAQSDSPEVNHG